MNKKLNSKYIWLFLLLFVLPLVTLAVLMFFVKLNCDHYVDIACALLTYVGTAVVSYVALYQSNQANQLSEKVCLLNEREYSVVFAITSVLRVHVKKCNIREFCSLSIPYEVLPFCDVDCTPDQCEGLKLCINNYGNYPITHVEITHTYWVGKKRTEERLIKKADILIPPHECQDIIVCNTPFFSLKGDELNLQITCQNTYGYISTIEFKTNDRRLNDNFMSYHCKVI